LFTAAAVVVDVAAVVVVVVGGYGGKNDNVLINVCLCLRLFLFYIQFSDCAATINRMALGRMAVME
jgi:hypothetical protein